MRHWSTLVLGAALIAPAIATPINSDSVTSAEVGDPTTGNVAEKPFVWASFGDSWASGIFNGLLKDTAYDGDKDYCRRSNDTYSAQLSREDSWVPGLGGQDFHSQACSQVVNGANHDDVPLGTDMILLQAGTDRALTARISNTCVFGLANYSTAPEWPQPGSQCAYSIEETERYINDDSNKLGTLFHDTQKRINAVFDHKNVKNNTNFRLFVPSYPQVFYDTGAEGDWCDTASFAVEAGGPKLILPLRKKYNQIMRHMNERIQAAIDSSPHAKQIKFIDTDNFVGHRFCEPGHTLYDQYFGDKVYFRNLAPDGVIIATDRDDPNKDKDEYVLFQPSDAQFDHWRRTGVFTQHPRELNFSIPRGRIPDVAVVSNMIIRPFRPKENGYKAMAQTIQDAIKAAYAGIDSSNKNIDIASRDAGPSGSLQILYAKYYEKPYWVAWLGPHGEKVNPCKPEGFRQVVTNVPDFTETSPPMDINNPPFPPAGSNWEIKSVPGHKDCHYTAGSGEIGQLVCDGGGFNVKGEKDFSWNDGVFSCSADGHGNFKYHRAWTVQWGPKKAMEMRSADVAAEVMSPSKSDSESAHILKKVYQTTNIDGTAEIISRARPNALSVQILYGQFGKERYWKVWLGPFGEAVDPCLPPKKQKKFKQVVDAQPAHGDNTYEPPHPREGFRWKIDIPDWDNCWYISESDGAGSLICGTEGNHYFSSPFLRDASWNQGLIMCWDNDDDERQWWYHRAWTTELFVNGRKKARSDTQGVLSLAASDSEPNQILDDNTLDRANTAATTEVASAAEYAGESIQIIYGRQMPYHFFDVWQGPIGIAVDPCKEPNQQKKFKRIVTFDRAYLGGDISRPIYVEARVTWPVDLGDGYRDCRIQGRDHQRPVLECGSTDEPYLSIEFGPDHQWNDGVIDCPGDDGWKFHRAWTVEVFENSRKKARNTLSIDGSKVLNSTNSAPEVFNTTTKAQSTVSLQIIWAQYGDSFTWDMFKGPKGVAVDPCNYPGFKPVVRGAVEPRNRRNFIGYPPYPSPGFHWPLPIEADGHDCYYESAAGSPGVLKCGDTVKYTFYADFQKRDKTINCGRGANGDFLYHRAWTLEY